MYSRSWRITAFGVICWRSMQWNRIPSCFGSSHSYRNMRVSNCFIRRDSGAFSVPEAFQEQLLSKQPGIGNSLFSLPQIRTMFATAHIPLSKYLSTPYSGPAKVHSLLSQCLLTISSDPGALISVILDGKPYGSPPRLSLIKYRLERTMPCRNSSTWTTLVLGLQQSCMMMRVGRGGRKGVPSPLSWMIRGLDWRSEQKSVRGLRKEPIMPGKRSVVLHWSQQRTRSLMWSGSVTWDGGSGVAVVVGIVLGVIWGVSLDVVPGVVSGVMLGIRLDVILTPR